jgi:hypothetical protein
MNTKLFGLRNRETTPVLIPINFRNFFSFRNLAILVITIGLSFTFRCLIIYFFTLDFSGVKDITLISVVFIFLNSLRCTFYVFFPMFEFKLVLCEGTDDGLDGKSNYKGKCKVVVEPR